MLADLTYEEVAARPSLPDLARTRHPQEFRVLLEGVTGAAWRVRTFWWRRPVLAQFAFPEWPVAVFVQDETWRPRLGQWVVVKRDLVHDPGEWAVCTVRWYSRRDWRITALAQPRRPSAFAEDQQHRRMARYRRWLAMEGFLEAGSNEPLQPTGPASGRAVFPWLHGRPGG